MHWRRGFLIGLLLGIVVAITWSLAVRLGLIPGPAGAPAAPAARMPALDSVAWLGGSAPAAPDSGAPEVIAVFSDTDPAAFDLLPAVEVWFESYARWGVEVRALHRPQFAFAADTAVAGRCVRRLGVGFPVALDPALALTVPLPAGRVSAVLVGDRGGAVQVTCVAPGDLVAADRWLRARIAALHPDAGVAPGPATFALPRRAPAPAKLVRLGAGQVPDGPLADVAPGVTHAFVTQTRFEEEGRMWTPVPVGRWLPGGDGLTGMRGGAANFVAIRYHAGRAGVVASPPAGAGARLWVLRDEAWLPAAARGPDVRADGTGATYVDVSEPRLYRLTSDRGAHVLKLSPDAPGLTLHALTFEDPAGAAAAPR